MKHNILSVILSLCVVSVFAVPAKRGQWKTLLLIDGTEVRAELRGDENAHWWQAADGACYVADGETGRHKAVGRQQLQAKAGVRRAAMAKNTRAKAMRRLGERGKDIFRGKKRGLIILAEFPDKKFSYDSPKALYNRIANEEAYSDHGFNGSIRDYFLEQSGGVFTLDFDVAGPVMMSHNYSYYGQDGEANAPEMIKEACKGVDSVINFADYDWDGDGEVEEVFVLYSGHGQADYDSNNDDLIWPHMYYVNPSIYPDNDFVIDGVKVDVYACSSELNGDGNIAGIGTFCHEFSHCMGFPDMYDTGDDGNFGMGSWDLMDYGSYNGDGYTPAGYSGYEKMVCGWTEPIRLERDTVIANVQPMSGMGQSFIVYNKGNENEFYILTNRQQTGYDACLPGHGLLVEHVDYDENAWIYNVVNTTDGTGYEANDHQRVTVFHANNSEDFRYEGGAAYPYNGNDSLTRTSSPSAKVYNANKDGGYYMNCAIRNIVESEDGTVSFSFGIDSGSGGNASVVVPGEGVLLRETFDKCNGTGGNDGKFTGQITTGVLTDDVCDCIGWDFEKGYRGDGCARFGTRNESGEVTSPSFTLGGDIATVTFRAACWDYSKDGTTLTVKLIGNGVKVVGSDGVFTMERGAWNVYSMKIAGEGKVKIRFSPANRFFLDDVMVVSDKVSTGIKHVTATKGGNGNSIYGLDGRYVGSDIRLLPHGIYIVNGRKVAK